MSSNVSLPLVYSARWYLKKIDPLWNCSKQNATTQKSICSWTWGQHKDEGSNVNVYIPPCHTSFWYGKKIAPQWNCMDYLEYPGHEFWKHLHSWYLQNRAHIIAAWTLTCRRGEWNAFPLIKTNFVHLENSGMLTASSTVLSCVCSQLGEIQPEFSELDSSNIKVRPAVLPLFLLLFLLAVWLCFTLLCLCNKICFLCISGSISPGGSCLLPFETSLGLLVGF